jgi:hypothetical protein
MFLAFGGEAIVPHNAARGKRIRWALAAGGLLATTNLLDSLKKSRYLKQANTPFTVG